MPHRTQLQLIKRRLSGVLVQLVEIPGLLSGAAEDRGRGRALLGVLRSADAIVYCLDVGGPYEMLQDVRNEVALAGIDLPSMLAATKMDEANEGDLAALQEAVPDLPVVGVSIIDDESLLALKEAVWKLTGLIRVYLRHNKQVDEEPLAMEPGATIIDVATKVHKELVQPVVVPASGVHRHALMISRLGVTIRCKMAKVWRLSPSIDGVA